MALKLSRAKSLTRSGQALKVDTTEDGTEEKVMHELSLAVNILELAQEEADRRGGLRVSAIHLRMGPLSGW